MQQLNLQLGATNGLSLIQYKFSYVTTGGNNYNNRWTSIPLNNNTFQFFPNINAFRGALEVRTVFNNTPVDMKSISIKLTDQPVAPSFSSNPTINDVTAASGDTITVGSFTIAGNPTHPLHINGILTRLPLLEELIVPILQQQLVV